MTRQSRHRWLAYAAAIFLTGAASGALFGWSAAWHHRRPQAGRTPGPPSGTHLCEHLRRDLAAAFSLDREQHKALEPILARRAQALDQMLDRSRTELEAIHQASDREIAAALQLTPAQTEQLATLGRRGFGPERKPPHPGPSPGQDGPPGRHGHGHEREPHSHPPDGTPRPSPGH